MGLTNFFAPGGATSFVKRYDAREFRNEILSLFNCDGQQPYANCSIVITGQWERNSSYRVLPGSAYRTITGLCSVVPRTFRSDTGWCEPESETISWRIKTAVQSMD